MEVKALNDVGVRKKALKDMGKIKDKLSEETNNLIKLRVKQDAAYWDLHKKLADLEGKHERLQQNMVQLQMEYETLSSQYQEELRRRPEVLNNLMSNRKIYDVLEENQNRIRASLQRSTVDRNALAEAYDQASKKVTAAQTDYMSQIKAANDATRSAQDLAKLKEEQCTQLSVYTNWIRYDADKVKTELKNVREQRDCLTEKMAEKEKTITELRDQIQRASVEYNETQKKFTADLERQTGAASALREALAEAESRCEMLTREGKRLSSELLTANTNIAQMENQNQELQSVCEESKRSMNYMVNKTEQIVKELNAKTQKIQSLEEALDESKKETQTATEFISQLKEELERKRLEYTEQITSVNNEIIRQREDHERNLNECKEIITSLTHENQELTKSRDELHVTITELNSVIERERSNKEDIIKSLQEKLTNNKEEIAHANNAIEEHKAELVRKHKDFEEQKTAFEVKLAESEEVNAQMKRAFAEEMNAIKAELNTARAAIRNKDDEASKQMKIILTARAENEQLQGKIRELQETIKGIQQMTHPRPKTPVSVHRELPEQDHNVMDVPPAPVKQVAQVGDKIQKPPMTPISSVRPMPPAVKNPRELIYNIFSDTDTSNDDLEINGRVEALSRDIKLPPIYKRRPRPRMQAKTAAPVTTPVQVTTEPMPQGQTAAAPKRKFFKSKRPRRD